MEQNPNPSFEENDRSNQADFDRWEQELQGDPNLEVAALEQEFADSTEADSSTPVEMHLPNTFLPNSTGEGRETLERYNNELNSELSRIDRGLDSVRDKISTKAQAEEWQDIKRAIAHTKNIQGDLGRKIDLVTEIQQATVEFRRSLSVFI